MLGAGSIANAWRRGREQWASRIGSPRARPPARALVLDVETSDLDAQTGAVIELGLCPVIDDRRLPAVASLVKPPKGTRIAREAAEVHRITAQKLRGAEDFPTVWGRLMAELTKTARELVDNADKIPIIAHNAEFDRSFIRMEASRGRWPKTPPGAAWLRPEARWIDTLWMARRDHGELPGFTLDRVAAHCGVTIKGTRHTAATDVEVLAECVRHWPAPGTTGITSDLFTTST